MELIHAYIGHIIQCGESELITLTQLLKDYQTDEKEMSDT